MCSFYLSLALALAITFTSFGSTRAAPAFVNHTSFGTGCNDGEYCDEAHSSCCLDCAALHRIPGDGCAKTESDCYTDCLDGYEKSKSGNECIESSTDEYELEGPNGGTKEPPGPKHGVRPGSADDKIETSVGYVWIWIIIASSAVLTVVVVAVVCIGRGRLPWKRPRLGEDDNRGVPEGIELQLAGADGDDECYEPKVREPVRNRNDEPDIVLALIGDELRNQDQVAVQVQAQQPYDTNGPGDEVSMPLVARGALAFPANNLPGGVNANEVEVGNNVNEPAAPEQERVDQNIVGNLPDFVEARETSANVSRNDSGIVADDEGYDPMEHQVPHSPSSPDSQLPDESAQDNSIANVSKNNPQMLEIKNFVNHDEPKVAIRGRKRSAGGTVGENRIGL